MLYCYFLNTMDTGLKSWKLVKWMDPNLGILLIFQKNNFMARAHTSAEKSGRKIFGPALL